MLSTPTNIHEIEAYVKSLLAKDWMKELSAADITLPPIKYLILKDMGWTFDYDNAKRRFGLCSYMKNKITLSLPLVQLNLDKPEEIKETALHEVAHSLSFVIFGRQSVGHGKLWKMVAKAIGSNSNRCYDVKKVDTPKSKYVYECPKCSLEYKRHKKMKSTSACGICCKKFNSGKYSEEYILILKADCSL